MKKCPFCSEEIQENAVKCRYCGEWLEGKSKSKVEEVRKKENILKKATMSKDTNTGKERRIEKTGAIFMMVAIVFVVGYLLVNYDVIQRYIKTNQRLAQRKAPSKKYTNTASNSSEAKSSVYVDKFSYHNIRFRKSVDMTAVMGEITNNSGKDYKLAGFKITVYDSNGNLIGVGSVHINLFPHGATRSFDGVIDANSALIDKYKINFSGGLES